MYLPHVAIGMLFSVSLSGNAVPQPPSVLGDWTDPTGSVIRVAQCGHEVCAQIVELSSRAPSKVDINNPDASMRSHRLCGLVIGQAFHLVDPTHAEGGSLYDPQTGRTYHGSMSRDGELLNLRGYVGFKLFGRTEQWHSVAHPEQPCSGASK